MAPVCPPSITAVEHGFGSGGSKGDAPTPGQKGMPPAPGQKGMPLLLPSLTAAERGIRIARNRSDADGDIAEVLQVRE